MKGKDLIQPNKNKRPLLGIKLIDSKMNFYYKANNNIITDKNGKVVKWCDAKRNKLYMFWQRIKYKVFRIL